MCRIAAWTGRARPLSDIVVAPAHSLLEQSQHAQEAKLSVNGDGFGFGWYDGHQCEPGLYRDVLPAWSDGNLLHLCRMIRSPLFVAHVRASTIGETARNNCHPFVHGRWTFCHNGQIPAFPGLRRRMEAALPDALYHARKGTTDSEMLFLTLLANGLDQDVSAALRRTFEALAPVPGARPNRATLVFSNGCSVFACRLASDSHAPSLYLKRDNAQGGHVLASEPLDSNPNGWSLITPGHLVEITSDQSVASHSLQARDAA